MEEEEDDDGGKRKYGIMEMEECENGGREGRKSKKSGRVL